MSIRIAEQLRGHDLAGPLAGLLDNVASDLHHNESLHLHDVTDSVGECGYCYLRAGRTLGIVANLLGATAGPQHSETEGESIRRFLDTLPIYATRVGYRTDSTDEERALGEAAFAAHRRWLEVRP